MGDGGAQRLREWWCSTDPVTRLACLGSMAASQGEQVHCLTQCPGLPQQPDPDTELSRHLLLPEPPPPPSDGSNASVLLGVNTAKRPAKAVRWSIATESLPKSQTLAGAGDEDCSGQAQTLSLLLVVDHQSLSSYPRLDGAGAAPVCLAT